MSCSFLQLYFISFQSKYESRIVNGMTYFRLFTIKISYKILSRSNSGARCNGAQSAGARVQPREQLALESLILSIFRIGLKLEILELVGTSIIINSCQIKYYSYQIQVRYQCRPVLTRVFCARKMFKLCTPWCISCDVEL